MAHFKIIEGLLNARDFNRLRAAVGWERHTPRAVRKALKNTHYLVTVQTDRGEVIGMARVIGDIGVNFYIQDVIILPEYQDQGLGKKLMDKVMGYIKKNARPGCFIGLMSAVGKEGFYERYGFIKRPAKGLGCGMSMDWK
jgi:ribosomal protein S18 acetylase RimI-like enzyme